MASDAQVTSKMILETLQELSRTGTTPVLEHLEKVEPDLASYLMESLTTIYHKILGLGGSAKKSKRLYGLVKLLALVCILALQKGHYELWRQADGDDDGGDGDGDGDDEEESPGAPPPQLPPQLPPP